MNINKQDLIDFEKEVITKFKEGNTYGPVHLSGGNEEQLLEIFKKIKPEDWVFTTHRSHYHSLLKSGDKEWLTDQIIVKANSSHINSVKYKIFSSAIVGGIIPIALGTALGIKMKYPNMYCKGCSFKCQASDCECTCHNPPHVWCFVGDMASEMGCFHEALKYAIGEDLPITFIIEDNELSCNTPTREVWKTHNLQDDYKKIIYYKYKRYYPHYGIGEFVTFKKKKIKSMGDYQAYHLK